MTHPAFLIVLAVVAAIGIICAIFAISGVVNWAARWAFRRGRRW